MLTGLSVDYVVRLEQGRSAHPSEQVIRALTRVLQLSPTERDHLFAAAGLRAPSPTAAPTLVPANLQRIVARLPDVAVAVYTAHWTLLTANDAWESLLGRAPEVFNLIIGQFTGTAPPVLTTPEYTESFERALVSDLRTALLRYPEDPDVRAVLDQLINIESFRAYWEEGSMGEHHSEVKTFSHPLVGPISLDCDVLTVAGSDLRIVTYTPVPGSEDASRFDLVRTVGVGARNFSGR